MANHGRDAKRETRWRGVLKRYAASGLTIRAFCQRERLAESAFFAWRRTIAQRDAEARPQAGLTTASRRRGGRSQRPAFLPVLLADNHGHGQAIVIELAPPRRAGSVRVLRVPESIAAERLVELVQALEGGPRQ
jgi:transposase